MPSSRLSYLLLSALLFLSVTGVAAVNAQDDCWIVASCPPSHTHAGGAVTIHVQRNSSEAGATLGLLSIARDGLPATPADTPVLSGLRGEAVPQAEEVILYWRSQGDEAGEWEFCFEAILTSGDRDTCCQSVTVEPLDPDVMAWQSRHIRLFDGGGPSHSRFELDFVTDDTTQGAVLYFYLRSLSGGAYIAEPVVVDNAGFSEDMDVFEQQSPQNPVFTNDADPSTPDSILAGLIDFGGAALAPGTWPAAYFFDVEIRTAEGLFVIDTQTSIWLTQFNQTSQPVVVPSFMPGCYAVTRDGPCPIHRLGDVNLTMQVTSADIIWIVNFIFKGGRVPLPCEGAADYNCDGQVNSADLIRMVGFVFKGWDDTACDICPLIAAGTWPCQR